MFTRWNECWLKSMCIMDRCLFFLSIVFVMIVSCMCSSGGSGAGGADEAAVNVIDGYEVDLPMVIDVVGDHLSNADFGDNYRESIFCIGGGKCVDGAIRFKYVGSASYSDMCYEDAFVVSCGDAICGAIACVSDENFLLNLFTQYSGDFVIGKIRLGQVARGLSVDVCVFDAFECLSWGGIVFQDVDLENSMKNIGDTVGVYVGEFGGGDVKVLGEGVVGDSALVRLVLVGYFEGEKFRVGNIGLVLIDYGDGAGYVLKLGWFGFDLFPVENQYQYGKVFVID